MKVSEAHAADAVYGAHSHRVEGSQMSAKSAGRDDMRDSDESGAKSGVASKVRKSGAIGLGAAAVASAVLMLATFALAIAPTAYYGPDDGGGGGGDTEEPAASGAVSDNGTV